jgi:hypothetical protein
MTRHGLTPEDERVGPPPRLSSRTRLVTPSAYPPSEELIDDIAAVKNLVGKLGANQLRKSVDLFE